MATRVIGLDVGTNAVRAIEVELGDVTKVHVLGQVGLPDGAVVGGEVIDVATVSEALRRLWIDCDFSTRTVRVAMSSARVIVRTIEMQRLSRADLLSAIRLQLDEYVPLPADETVFDVRPLDGSDTAGPSQQLLLTATHQDAAERLVLALRDADLKVAAIDVVPAALALALTRPEADDDGTADLLVSIGAGTLVVVAARGGEVLSSRILSNVSGRGITDAIADHLSVSHDEAERIKRLGSSSEVDAVGAATSGVDELVGEVFDSIAFYAGQPDARPVRRVVLTGGGSLLPGLDVALAERLGLPVCHADPFAHVHLDATGFEAADLPYLAPYMAAALGVALGAGRPKGRRIDLTPVSASTKRTLGGRRTVAVAVAVVVLGAGGAVFVSGRGALADEQRQIATARSTLVVLQDQITSALPAGAVPADGEDDPDEIAASVAPMTVDWLEVEAALSAGSAQFAVSITAFDGVLEPPAGTVVGSVVGSVVGRVAGAPTGVARLALVVVAPDLDAVADWLDALSGDPRFASPAVGGLTMIAGTEAAPTVQFTLQLVVTDQNLLDRVPATVAA